MSERSPLDLALEARARQEAAEIMEISSLVPEVVDDVFSYEAALLFILQCRKASDMVSTRMGKIKGPQDEALKETRKVIKELSSEALALEARLIKQVLAFRESRQEPRQISGDVVVVESAVPTVEPTESEPAGLPGVKGISFSRTLTWELVEPSEVGAEWLAPVPKLISETVKKFGVAAAEKVGGIRVYYRPGIRVTVPKEKEENRGSD